MTFFSSPSPDKSTASCTSADEEIEVVQSEFLAKPSRRSGKGQNGGEYSKFYHNTKIEMETIRIEVLEKKE